MIKKTLQYIGFLPLALFITVACSDNEDESIEFKGEDAFITSFRLEKEETIYKGVITEKQITLSLPATISISGGVTPTIEVSENATLTPSPAEITNWEEDIQFIVKSYNGETTNIYLYSVERETISIQGDVYLSTQEEVDAFAVTKPEIIDGKLFIGKLTGETAKDSIYDLSGLSSLKRVTYGVVINPTYAEEKLEGLVNLETIGGLALNNVNTLQEINLKNLLSIKENLEINATALKGIDAGQLIHIGKNVTLSGNQEMKILSFPQLKKIGDKFSLSSYEELISLDMPTLEYAGSIFLTDLPMLEKIELPSLLTIEGELKLNYFIRLESISFPELNKLGSLTLGTNTLTMPTVYTIDFPVLKTIHGNMDWDASCYPNVKEIVLPQLETIEGNILFTTGSRTNIQIKDNVETISLPLLRSISGHSLHITTALSILNSSLSLLDFSSLTEVDNIRIENQSKLESFDTFKNALPVLDEETWQINNCLENPSYEEMYNLFY